LRGHGHGAPVRQRGDGREGDRREARDLRPHAPRAPRRRLRQHRELFVPAKRSWPAVPRDRGPSERAPRGEAVLQGGCLDALLKELARNERASMQEVLERAVEGYRRRRFLESINEGYAAVRGDADAWSETDA